MKKIILLTIMVVSGVTAMAQSTREVKGTVTDKSGNPIPGVRVETKESTETTVTDIDGSFTIKVLDTEKKVTARYAGLQPTSKAIQDGMVIVMKPGRSNKGFSEDEGKSANWFLSAQGSLSLGDIYSASKGRKDMSGKVGLMVGVLAKGGVYTKVMFCPDDDTKCKTFNSISLGVTTKIFSNFYAYFGAGYSQIFSYKQYTTTSTPFYSSVNRIGNVFETGFIGKIGRHFMINAGYGINTNFHSNSHDINFGIGYVF